MPFTDDSDVRLYYETSGPESGEPLILIQGLSAQMVAWHPGFVCRLEQEGFHVIRFDNRDVGLSERFEGSRSEYRMEDMSDDVVRLMDHLELPVAHIAGQSMGGVITQQLVLDHPSRVLSVCIMYSAHMFEYLSQDEEVIRFNSLPPAGDRDERIARYIEGERLSGLEELDEKYVRDLAELVVDRAWDPAGVQRQMEAILRMNPQPERLRDIRKPTALIHGRADRLVPFEASLEMGRLIPDAEVHILPGMGHQVRPSNWPDFIRALRRNVERSDRELKAARVSEFD